MSKLQLLRDVLATYERHGWRLRGVLLTTETRKEVGAGLLDYEIKESAVDALWFSRPSHHNREAWELRLLAETQYALFETFEAEETEERRADVMLEMEARLREYANRD
ncbi:MAG: hypothetical protein C5B55_13270 [Blastocatellia bacterium]|nr:MAG: hypothetical protein C5B55_13270 [Blastocatellia bacterium]